MAAPWGCVVDPVGKTAVGIAFESDNLVHLYAWRDSKIAPTFEFACDRLPEGKSVDFTYYWLIAHGLDEVDYACKEQMLSVKGVYNGDNLAFQLDSCPLTSELKRMNVSAQILDPERKELATIKPECIQFKGIDRIAGIQIGQKLVKHPYVIAKIKIESDTFAQPYVFEKVFALNNKEELIKDYQTPVIRLKKTTYKDLAEWSKDTDYELSAADEDKERGYMIFSEFGNQQGIHNPKLTFALGLNEQESFALHFRSLGFAGKVDVKHELPHGIQVDVFDTAMVPQSIWGRIMNGYKLIPATSFTVKNGDDKIVYFRLRPDFIAAKKTKGKISFIPENSRPTDVNLNLSVYPVRIPEQPRIVFDVNNLVEDLCSSITDKEMEWSDIRTKNYMTDMMEHGVRGQTSCGRLSPFSHYAYDKIKLKGSGSYLIDSIKKDPAAFRNTLNLPELDFSYWDSLADNLLRYGQTHLRWPAGGCGSSFSQLHNSLTKTIYGCTFPDGDIRQQIIRDWYFGQVVKYFKDRGIPRIMATIDDEIPVEKYPCWTMHAYDLRKLGVMTAVTQNAKLLERQEYLSMLSPFMNYWILGTLHKPTLDQRRSQNVIKPEDWLTTYNATANHWRSYESMRGWGIWLGYMELDACWIQCYWRWKQTEAIIYPGEDGPYSSAAWEGARDGLDDGNYYVIALNMISALPPDDKIEFGQRLKEIISTSPKSLISITEKMDETGIIDAVGRFRGKAFISPSENDFREMKARLLALITEMSHKVPVQAASVNFGDHAVLREGKSVFKIPENMTFQAYAMKFFELASNKLDYSPPVPEKTGEHDSIFFIGTMKELNRLLPQLAKTRELSDLGQGYPLAGNFVVRFVKNETPSQKAGGKQVSSTPAYSMLIIVADKAGAKKALDLLPRVVTYPRNLYSQSLPAHHRKSN
jgi:hypothetical protein